MPEIVPAIIAKDFKEMEAKVSLVEPFVKTVQLDIMDGIFVPNTTWPYSAAQSGDADNKPSPRDLDKIETTLDFEAHLMVEAPHRVLNEWLNSSVKRVVLHWEALEKIHNHELLPYKTQVTAGFPVRNLAEEAHRRNKELGVALNLETPVTVLDNFMSYIDSVLLMSVKPGQGGQKFEKKVIPKIIALRQKYPGVKIGIDGGVNEKNTKEIIEAGADFLVMGSTIFQKENIPESIKNINNLIKK
ncbi:MAG TPA: hypothetical protein P5089_01400 [Candidatus Portnoybacteria bacterium]|nr:hypothetical protein [Candidatus Portnoybacteria bacterium]